MWLLMNQIVLEQVGTPGAPAGSHRLTSIDSDHVYVDAVEERTTVLGREVKVLLKSMAFCSDMMVSETVRC